MIASTPDGNHQGPKLKSLSHKPAPLNPKPLNPKPLNPKPLNPNPLNPQPLNPKFRKPAFEAEPWARHLRARAGKGGHPASAEGWDQALGF